MSNTARALRVIRSGKHGSHVNDVQQWDFGTPRQLPETMIAPRAIQPGRANMASVT
jgi:hypothetical protein